MNESPFNKFIELINFDRTISHLQDQLKKIEKELAVVHGQQKHNAERLEAAKRDYVLSKKDVDAKELEMKTLDQQVNDKKNRLENVTNHKEYKSVKLEADTVKAKQHTLEKLLMNAWQAMETATKTYEQHQQEFTTHQESLVGTIQTMQQQIAELNAEIAGKKQERPAKEKDVPSEWLEKYAAMRTRVSDPVVAVDRGNCTACFYKVSDQDLLSLGRHKLLQCKDCYRFLYIESPDRTTN